MHIVAVAWMFVVVLMAAAEAMTGAYAGALGTLLLYGILPLGIVLYLLATPARRRARALREAQGESADANALLSAPPSATATPPPVVHPTSDEQ
jgi:hypothetical protein